MLGWYVLQGDGRMSDWVHWSSCSASCGHGVKTRARARLCNNPPPLNGGKILLWEFI